MFRALGAVVAIFLFYVPAVAQAGFSEAMWSVFGSEWDAAREQVADSDEAAQDVIEWYRLRAGVGSFSEYNAFLHRRSDWPGLPLLKEMGEAAIPAEADAFTVIEYFGQDAPQTGQGALRLAQALRTSGETARADAVIVSAWRNMVLSEELEAQMVAGFAEALLNHHRARQDMLLWRDQTEAALRLNPLVGTAHVRLALARAALIDREEGVDDLIDRVPESLADHPGLAFARFEWRLAAGREDSAVDLMLERSGSARSLGQPEAWAPYRLRMARALMENGSAKKAYAVASQHHLPVGEDYAHLEWLSGYLAFSFLKDPAKALPHFRALRSGATTPISLGRAGYWEAQAAKALGRTEEARAALAFAADFPTSFYGLLAAEELRLGPDKRLLGNPAVRDWNSYPMAQSTVYAAALHLHEAGHGLPMARFLRHLSEILLPEEHAALARNALLLEEPYAALQIARYAADNGTVLPDAGYPVISLPNDLSGQSPALVLSIIRRESGFFPGARSPAGAQGMMQLMPATARQEARRLGLDYAEEMLIGDPVYNIRLGSAYLSELQEEFGPNLALVAAAYNAGPTRARRWLRDIGDPRTGQIGTLDWIERVPYAETRNYIMRVLEAVPVYQWRLGGDASRIGLAELLGRL